uniref:ADP-ribosylation factor-like protein 4A n=1 Tax=Myxine glutinosa TaxID=7769 RepID=UPI00358FE372
MGNCFAGELGPALSSLSRFHRLHVAIFGLDFAGKTSLLYRLKLGENVRTLPTVGFNTERLQLQLTPSRQCVPFHFWDVGGQDKLRPLWRSYARGADALIFVVDSADPERFEEARAELLRVVRLPRAQEVPLLVFANKQDLPQSVGAVKLEKILGLSEFGTGMAWHMQAVSADTGRGLHEGLARLHEMIMKRRKGARRQRRKWFPC